MKSIYLLTLLMAWLAMRPSDTEPAAQKLHLSYLNLKTIDLDSAQASTLVEIDVSGNPITTLPASLVFAKDLKTVKLNSCKNISWDQLIKLLKKLRVEEIEMDFCNLSYIPLEFAELKSLRKISMRSNALSELPWNLFLNTKLQYLDLENNQIEEMGKELGYIRDLSYLNLSGNPCINVPSLWKQLPDLANLQALSLNGCTKIPTVISLPPHLKELHLDDCKAALPKSIDNAGELELLSIMDYGLNVSDLEPVLLPFKGEKSLREIRFSSVYISKISPALLNFSQLQGLQLECGKLTEVCDLSLLKSLKSLSLKSSDTNAIDLFIKSAGKASLQQLNLQNSGFKHLPASIGSLKSLKQLNVQNCEADNIFSVLSKLDSLKEADFRGCSFIDTSEINSYQKAHPGTLLYYNKTFTPASKTKYINKPFADLVLPTQQFLISNLRDTVLSASDGSKIMIPANSIVDALNKPIKEPVRISYTTYKEPEEIFASGIPMTADSAGQTYNFASAGMFSLNATQANGKKAFLAKGKEMSIDFTSAYPNQSYNYYYLDTLKRNWIQTGTDKIKIAEQIKPKPEKKPGKKPINPDKVAYGTIHIKTTENKPRKTKPKFKIYYTMKNNVRHADTVLYNPQELQALKDIEWEYAGSNNKDFFALLGKPAYFSGLREQHQRIFSKDGVFLDDSKEGVEFSLAVDKEHDCYNFIFSTNIDSIVIPVVPVIGESNPAKIQKSSKATYDKFVSLRKDNNTFRNVRIIDFTREYNMYERKMAEYGRLLNAYTNSYISYDEYMKLYNDYTINNIDSMANFEVSNENVVRSLSLTGFGTYNCDYFTRNENWIVSNPKFIDEETGTQFRPQSVTLIDLKDNAYISGVQKGLKLAKNKDYWIFTMGKEGYIGFAAFSTGKGDFDKIDIKQIKAKTIKELREQLKY